jgi:hypothetical protein
MQVLDKAAKKREVPHSANFVPVEARGKRNDGRATFADGRVKR